jgi:hypothetical protein
MSLKLFVLLLLVAATLAVAQRLMLRPKSPVASDDNDADDETPPSEIVARLGVTRQPGKLYFLRGSEVWSTGMRAKGSPLEPEPPMLVARAEFVREKGYFYFLDRDGNIARARRVTLDDDEIEDFRRANPHHADDAEFNRLLEKSRRE